MPRDECPRSPDRKHRWIALAAGEVCEACGAVRLPEKPADARAGATS